MKINLEKEYDIYISPRSQKMSLGDILMKSERTILYFYPRDNTPGCTVEAKDFTCLVSQFGKKGIQIVGVSKDTLSSHEKFVQQQELGIVLISDTDLVLHKEFGVYGEKNNYGKVSLGVIRSTFLLDVKGNILQEWRNVKAAGHAAKVLSTIS